ncbi:ClpP/crotonase [Gigaspora margarita]|uniref:ClpP/crotonase n=1 Tax=Gigaspora margarita TaxID=4874 RepID=A0A8H4AUR4_GIGMA|nr:ClpP/crotonase [Gigaspora margarita]
MPNQQVTLTREGPLFILSMQNGENRFTTNFINEINAILDEIENIIKHENSERAALITIGEGKVLTFPIPTVAAINGHAFAGGFMLALAHDYRVMRADRGYMCMNEIEIPYSPHPGMAAIIRIKMTPKTYRDCMIQAHRFTGPDALDQGLVDIIASENDVLPKAKELALKWSKRASAGAIYGNLKEEMYVEAINYLEIKNWKPKL